MTVNEYKFLIDPENAPQAFIGIEEINNQFKIIYQNESAIELLGNNLGKNYINFLNKLKIQKNIEIHRELIQNGSIKNITCKYNNKYLILNGKFRSDNKFQMSFLNITEFYLDFERKKIETEISKIMSADFYLEEKLKIVIEKIATYPEWEEYINLNLSSFFIQNNRGKFIQFMKGKNKETLEELSSKLGSWTCICKKTITEKTTIINSCQDTIFYAIPLKGNQKNVFGLMKIHFNSNYKQTKEIIKKNKIFLEEIANNLSFNILLDKAVYYDPMTKLAKRELLYKYLLKEISFHKRKNKSFYIIGFDLDNFKLINDNYGHEIGDKVLFEIGKRIIESVREHDTIARVGGDEFVGIIITEKQKEVDLIAKRLLENIQKPLIINGNKINVGVSIGISSFPKYKTPEDLLKMADLALYYVKRHGKNNFIHYEDLLTKN